MENIMDYWKELNNLVMKMQSDINPYNVWKLRSNSDFCSSLIKYSKYAMYAGRTNRAWALLIMAISYWENTRRQ